ncbi:thioredoxin family protein [Candidatus Bipolaricaulota bacterium]|nr:thioredoxin family protein [Candidatus Bipolaricaulota bacterium]
MKWAEACRWCAGVVWFLLAILVAAFSGSAQSSILEFSFDSESLAIPLNGAASVWLRIDNASVYEADAIEIAWLDGPVLLNPVEPIEVLDAFSDGSIPIILSAGSDAALGESEAVFEVSYTYCINDLCFQIIEQMALRLEFIPAVVDPLDVQIVDPVLIPPEAEPSAFPPLFAVILGSCLAGLLVVGNMSGRRWWVTLLLVVVIGVGLGYGILLKQDQQAQSIGAVLCTSCVGIEETPHEPPDLSDNARARVQALTDNTELLLFTAVWCHACPYAKAMVQQVVAVNPLVTVQLIDVDESQNAASQYGIVQSGRTIVPAILRVDTGEVIFGIEDLEARLMSLLEGSP